MLVCTFEVLTRYIFVVESSGCSEVELEVNESHF